jgi:hypothetical protein
MPLEIILMIWKVVSNPKVMIGLLAAGLITYAVFEHKSNEALHKDVAAQTLVIKQLQSDQKIMTDDVTNLVTSVNKIGKIRVKQANVNQAIAAIPDTSQNSKPFANPDLLNAAQQLRNYQSSPDSNTTD